MDRQISTLPLATLRLCPTTIHSFRNPNAVRHQTLHRIQRFLAMISFLSLLSILLISLHRTGYNVSNLRQLIPPGTFGTLFNRQIAIVSGHAGYDPGAVCLGEAGTVTLTEAALNATIAEAVRQQLRRRGVNVLLLEEFDERLEALEADLLVSLHADSCIDASGYKIAYASRAEVILAGEKLEYCFTQHYAVITELTLHADTITHGMTNYHAFRRVAPTTPAIILEMGFIGGDQQLLQQRPNTVARGITASIRCFFESEQATR